MSIPRRRGSSDDIIAVGKLDVCLCLSVVPTFCQEHPVAKNAVALVGEARVTAILEDLVRSPPLLTFSLTYHL